MVRNEDRRLFDAMLDEIMEELPDPLHELMEEVPLIVEDEPSAKLLEEMGPEAGDADLCGLHWGTPLPDRAMASPGLPDRMMLFRGPIMRLADYRGPRSNQARLDELYRQIRITLLHEIGHHFGMDEDDLARLGYD